MTGDRGRMNRWKELRKLIHFADVILEIVDARNIPGTRLPVAERWAGTRRLMVVVNKTDLLAETREEHGLERMPLPRGTIRISAKTATEEERRGLIRQVLARTQKRPVHALLVGYPNVGKSTLINFLAKRRAARVSPVAGTTRGLQWITVNSELMVSDYRGVFPEYEKKESLVRKGAVNAQGNEELYVHRFANRILERTVLRKWIEKRYDMDLSGAETSEDVLRVLAERRKWYLKGGELNVAEAARELVRAMKEAPEV